MNRVTGALEQQRRFYTEAPYSRVGSIDRDNQDTEQPGHIWELGYPGHIWELGYPGHIRELGYPGHIW